MDNVISELLKERDALRARIRDHERKAYEMRQTLKSLDATLIHLGHTGPGFEDPAKRKLTDGLFYSGELPRMLMRVLRANPDGLTLRKMTEQVCAEKGWELDDARFYGAVSSKVSRNLDKYKKRGLVELYDGAWRLSAANTQPNPG
ncbi:hypothetical protein FF098_001970 [Parvularcula flava]|uniref:Uncharacterized protein n=1 Tax=Aquisalinus luteolus TaxID=1566827 RepID=A0A8J3EPX4_9PROT|nr:hypothetical protein [Aquisalinus luteolus]NHK26673.1 hypothetical protein [Aquisalinus luteolus]GGH93057.1 hypothetical protein GCM10011355_04000 [Aquisalinus luteolus]